MPSSCDEFQLKLMNWRFVCPCTSKETLIKFQIREFLGRIQQREAAIAEEAKSHRQQC